MKVALVFLAIFASVFAGPVPEIDIPEQSYIFYERPDGSYGVEIYNATVEVFASASDITYFFYSRTHRNNPVTFTSTNVNTLQSRTDYNPNKRTLFIIHGWTNDYQSPVNANIAAAALDAADINVIVVDWSPISQKSYLVAQASVKQVGDFVGAVITQLNTLYRQSWNTITVAGHSLGAHIAGNAGAACRGQIGNLVGLDPAGPFFSESNLANRIDPTDGVYVEIIHTNDGKLGFNIKMGTSDYYPNGGKSQSGCGVDLTGSCSHSRAVDYYAESITRNSFLGRSCGSYADFTAGNCASRATARMGGWPGTTTARGDYFMTTNSKTPFGKGTA